MRRMVSLFAFLAGVLWATPSDAQLIVCDFQDTTPFTCSGELGSRDLVEINTPGTCAVNTFWGYTRVASGGWNDRGYVEYTWCDYDVSQSGDDSELAGFTESGSNFHSSGWPATTFYGRARLYMDTPIDVDVGGDNDHQFKWFVWHSGVYDGDQRVIAFLQGGSNCGEADTTHVCFTLQRNINHNNEFAEVALPLDTWTHLQWAWRHGVENTSYLRVWMNNDDEGSPTMQDTNLPAVPTNPGGTSEWVKDDTGYDDQFYVGNAANNGTRVDTDFVWRLMDFELDETFDSNWSGGGGGGGGASSVVRLRFSLVLLAWDVFSQALMGRPAWGW